MYSASVVDWVIVFCFRDDQEMAALARIKTNPEVECLSS
jgi:hypothetical protein